MGTSTSPDKMNADVGVPVPPDSDKSERFQDLVNVIFEIKNPLEELASVAVNDSHGAAEDITEVLKDINDNFVDGDGSLQFYSWRTKGKERRSLIFKGERSWNGLKTLLACNEALRMLLKLLKLEMMKVVTRPLQLPVSIMSPVKSARGNDGKVALHEELDACARLFESRHVARVHAASFGSILKWKVNSNISRPLMGVLYLKIHPDTMTLDMGEANKKLCITSDCIQQLFGFPRGGRSAPRPSEDEYNEALMKLRLELDIGKNRDIKMKDLRDKLKVLVKDRSKDDLALKVFFIIVFMEVVWPGAAHRVSRQAAMFEDLVIEDMANMDYCQLMVDELRRTVVRYKDGVTLGKAITGCAVGPILMYLDCPIRGKFLEVDIGKLNRKLSFSGCINIQSWRCRLRFRRFHLYTGFGIDVAVSALERTEHIFINVRSELEKVPSTVERLSCINIILPDGHQFNADEAVDYIEVERILISDMHDGAAQLIQSPVRLLNNMKRFKTMQDSRCNPYEESANVVITQIEQDEAAATASRASDGTEANVSDHHMNDVRLEPPVVEEPCHDVEAAIGYGVNDPSIDKSKHVLGFITMNQDPIVGDEPCSIIGDVPLSVSSNNISGVAVDAAKMTDVECEAAVTVGGDACGVPLSSEHDVGSKVANEDVDAASILDAKSSGVGIAESDILSGSGELPLENFPPRGLDYGDALQDADVSSMEEVPTEDDDFILSISSGPLANEALLSSQDCFSLDPGSATILLSSQDVASSNPESAGILLSSQELPSTNTESVGKDL
uniref:Uncharacterized protein n=1 Tax=Triticum aestivum TaxID=4565 RepID=A0A077RS37_WHEAT|nr:unnamed protein product [Triticum aestivum]